MREALHVTGSLLSHATRYIHQSVGVWARLGVKKDIHSNLSGEFSGLKRWDEGRWVKGSLVHTLLY